VVWLLRRRRRSTAAARLTQGQRQSRELLALVDQQPTTASLWP